MINGDLSSAAVFTLDGSPIMFWKMEKNVYVVINVFKLLCTIILLCNQMLSSSSSKLS